MADKPETPPRVIIAEDDALVLESEQLILRREGMEAIAVRSGVEFLEQIKKGPVDLVVLDLDLAGPPDGLDICKELKRHPEMAWVPVMFVTGFVTAETISKIFEAGGDEFVAKPFKPEELSARAKVLLRKGREERSLMEKARKLAEKIAERDDELDDLRRFAQDIVGSLPSALLVLGKEGVVLFVNAPFLDWQGLERRQVMGRVLSEFLTPGWLETPAGRQLNAAMADGRALRLPAAAGILARRPDVVCELTAAPINYAGARHTLLALEDATDQARAQAAAAREGQKLNDIVNAMNASLCLLGPQREILWKNRTFDHWFGDAFGQPGLPAFHSKLDESQELLDPVFAQGQIARFTWSLFTALGQRRHFDNIAAPIRDEQGGKVVQSLLLTQDSTEHETRVEQLSLLRELSQFLQRTLDSEKLNQVILLCVTAGHALGFNRAFLFMRNRTKNQIEARLAIGPASREEAFQVWAELSAQGRTLQELVADLDKHPGQSGGQLPAALNGLAYGLDDPAEIIVRTALEKKTQLVTDANNDPRVTDGFRRVFGSQEFISVPMLAKGSVVGVILADNLYSGRAITDDHVKLLSLFAGQAALALENAENYAELQKSLQELGSAQDRVVHAEKLAAVGKMAAHVAHEIRNPLATIGGFARAILKRPENLDRVTKNAKIIAEESTRLENMLKGVMDFSRPSTPVMKPGDLNATTEKAFRTNAEHLALKNIHADFDKDPSLPEVTYDENQIMQVLHNLIRNAADAMGSGGALTVKTLRQNDRAALIVRDTGSGIPPEVQERMFSPFITTKPDGTGLGLAVTKKIVDDHSGSIECTSEPGKGTTFTVYLPIKRDGKAALPPPTVVEGIG